MRKIVYLLPAVLITACSVIDQPLLPSGQSDGAHQGQYAQQGQYGGVCNTGTCAPGQSYSVANQNVNGAYGGYNEPSQYQPPQGYGQGYGAPVHVNPTGYGHQPAYVAGYGVPYGASGLRGRRAPGNFYGTLGGVWYDTEIDSFGVEGRLGYDSGRIWGAEVEGSVGIIDEDDTITVQGQNFDVDAGLDYNIAAFALARLPLSNRYSVHARAGYDFRSLGVRAEDASGASATDSIDLDGFAYGIGSEYKFSPRDAVRFDYTVYDNDEGEFDSYSLSYVRKF